MESIHQTPAHVPAVRVNGRDYRGAPAPIVVVCVDGSEPDYHRHAIEAGLMPYLSSVIGHSGSSLSAECTMPSFTNPNNLSIATGAPPSVHGICGNFFFNRETGEEVMMNDPSLLRAPTIFASYSAAGASVAIITAKDKLRRLLGAGLQQGICFSAEKADSVTMEENGIEGVLDLIGMPLPSVYSAELSEVAMAAAVQVLKQFRPDIMYVSLTDYIQHKHAPGTATANAFYAMLDTYYQQLDALGATLVITADHGMNAKSNAFGVPNVVFLQDVLDQRLGAGESRVILPITDPYPGHHGALGSYATIYIADTAKNLSSVLTYLNEHSGISKVFTAEEACVRFELPRDRIGEVVVVAGQNTVLGRTPSQHDLSSLDEPLRSHGGLTEQPIPFIVNRPVVGLPETHRLRNFDAYWVAANFTQPQADQPRPGILATQS